MKSYYLSAAAAVIVPALGTLTAGAAVVNTGFESGSYASTGLTDLSNITAPTLTAGAGANGSTALDFGSDGASGGGSQTIFASAYFSMMGRYNGNAGTSNGTMGFGWTRATGDFNPFNGSGTGVTAADHVTLTLARDAGNVFRLGAANGVNGAIGTGSLFGTSIASLTANDWYRLEGTVLYDSSTGTFTFNDVSLDHFGPTGAAQVTADLITGSGKTVTAAGFGTTAQPLFFNNRDRGFQILDNFVAVPEPGISLLILGSALVLGPRFRSRK